MTERSSTAGASLLDPQGLPSEMPSNCLTSVRRVGEGSPDEEPPLLLELSTAVDSFANVETGAELSQMRQSSAPSPWSWRWSTSTSSA